MRDERGRYITSKAIGSNGPEWAAGCDNCECGLVNPPELTGACSHVLERLVQAIDKQLTFCRCTAGQRYRSGLWARKLQLGEEAKRLPYAREWGDESIPEIDIARQQIAREMAKRVPTMHYEERVMA